MYKDYKIELVYGPWNEEHFESVQLELDLLDDIMWNAGYTIGYTDLYKAWLSGSDGIWEHPFDYDDDEVIIKSVLEYCTATNDLEGETQEEFEQWAREASANYSDVYEPLSQAEFDQIMDLLEESYEPEKNARVEGETWEPEADSLESPEEKKLN